MCDLDSVYYCFKEQYKKRLLEEYHSNSDKIYYVDILEYKKPYKDFINKIIYLLGSTTNFKNDIYLQIVDLLTSDKVIDRLNGLKRCKDFIKIK